MPSVIQKPLSEVTGGKKNSKIKWTKEMRRAFDSLKEMMAEDVELAFPSYEESAGKLILWVDASNVGAGACLQQEQDGVDRVIAYASMTFNGAAQRYSTVDKELAALRWGVKAFKSFLYVYIQVYVFVLLVDDNDYY